MYILVVPSLRACLSTKFITNSHQNFQFSQYLVTKLDMKFEIAKSVEIVSYFYPKIL